MSAGPLRPARGADAAGLEPAPPDPDLGAGWTARLEGGPFDGERLRAIDSAPAHPPAEVWIRRSSDPEDWGRQVWFTEPVAGTVHYRRDRLEAETVVYAFLDLGVAVGRRARRG